MKRTKILNGNPAREVEKDFLVLIFIENLFYYRHKKNVSDVSNICNITLIICKTTTLTPCDLHIVSLILNVSKTLDTTSMPYYLILLSSSKHLHVF